MKLVRRRMVVLGAAGAAAAMRPAAGRAAVSVALPCDDELQAGEASWYKKLEEGRVECLL